MTGVDEQLAFVRTCLDDDERVARAATAHLDAVRSFVEIQTPEVEADKAHMTRWDPERALAEVEAKRRILDAYEQTARFADAPAHVQPPEELQAWETAVRLLAQAFAGSEGWREEWATR